MISVMYMISILLLIVLLLIDIVCRIIDIGVNEKCMKQLDKQTERLKTIREGLENVSK